MLPWKEKKLSSMVTVIPSVKRLYVLKRNIWINLSKTTKNWKLKKKTQFKLVCFLFVFVVFLFCYFVFLYFLFSLIVCFKSIFDLTIFKFIIYNLRKLNYSKSLDCRIHSIYSSYMGCVKKSIKAEAVFARTEKNNY